MDNDAFLDELLVRIRDWLELRETEPVTHCESPSQIRQSVRLPPPLEGEGLNGVLHGIDQFLEHSVKTHHPNFMNPLWGGFSVASFAGEVISALAQTSMYTFELAPLASQIEQALLIRMREMIGFPTGTGVLTTGGSSGNLLGVLCARQQHDPLSINVGMSGNDYAVFVSDDSHYSLRMVVNVLGIGYDNLILVATDEDGRMRPAALIEEIEISIRDGKIPLCVVATSGTTVRGAFDPLKQISEIAHQYEMWMHVDAAWGGAALFSAKYSRLMDGIDLADSVSWDAHKMMGVSLTCSAYIVKNETLFKQVCSHGKTAHYLLHPETVEIDLGNISLQCGRRNDALKLWLAWKEKGDAGWARLVDSYVELADFLHNCVENNPELEMMGNREWANVCFRYYPPNFSGDLNELNGKIRAGLLQTGRFMVSRSLVGESVVI